jgi:hypothetical protein
MQIIIEVSEQVADEIREWKDSHPRMMITSTVPARHSWAINSEDIHIGDTLTHDEGTSYCTSLPEHPIDGINCR